MLRDPTPPAAPVVEASRELTITVERGVTALATYRAQWEDLADHAVAPNPFYEPHALLPALEHFPDGRHVEVVCVWAPNPLPKQPAILCGLFPLVRQQLVHRSQFKALPLRVLGMWRHLYAYTGTPLVRASRAAETLDAFFAWLPNANASLFVWDQIVSDDGFRHALTDALQRHQRPTFEDERHTRAMFRPSTSADAFVAKAIGGKKQKELRRQLRRLNDVEPVTFEVSTDVDRWVTDYIELEARGWKGGKGTSLKEDVPAATVFRLTLRGAFERARLQLWTMRQASRALPIAMKCNLRAGAGAVAFKIAYDEELSKFSPGVLLEMEHITWMHEPAAPAWVDSGAAARHPMIEHLWRDRIGVETLSMPIDLAASIAIAAFPLVRLAQSTIKRLRSRKP